MHSPSVFLLRKNPAPFTQGSLQALPRQRFFDTLKNQASRRGSLFFVLEGDEFSVSSTDALEYSYEMYIDSLSFSHTDIKSAGKGGLYAEDFKGGWS